MQALKTDPLKGPTSRLAGVPTRGKRCRRIGVKISQRVINQQVSFHPLQLRVSLTSIRPLVAHLLVQP